MLNKKEIADHKNINDEFDDILGLFKTRNFDDCFEKITKKIQFYQSQLAIKPYCKESRKGMMICWKFIKESIFYHESVELPLNKKNNIRGNPFQLARAFIVDNVIENDWKKQCIGKFGGPKPSALSWKQFYFLSESEAEKETDFYEKIKWCAENGHINHFKFLLSNYEKIDINAIVFNNGDNLLAKVINKQFKTFAHHLLDNKSDVNTSNNNGWTPLHYAINNGNLEITKQLLRKKISLNSKDKKGRTPLHIATIKNFSDIIKLLLSEGVKANIKDYNGFSPMHYALFNFDLQAVELIIKYGGDINVKDHFDRTFLHWASSRGNANIINLLIKHNINKNSRDKFGCTPLHYAVQSGDINAVDALLKNQIQVNINNKFDETPLRVAAFFGFKKGLSVLYEQGAR
ncbi:hypothetical protein DID78_05100 [Candidatus Marinamargulisbacteria bacterium SCGC AG-343-D04]|nr:hypothetical protein DID78_05100 [Candidatus Marinamargulisbacteria bacterium SCGC AG-343-D04]